MNHRRLSQRLFLLLPYLLLGGLALWTASRYQQYQAQAEALVASQSEAEIQAVAAQLRLSSLLSLDTLALTADPAEARQAYRALAQRTPADTLLRRLIQARLAQLDTLAALRDQVEGLQQLPRRQELVAYQQQTDSLNRRLEQVRRQQKSQVDSLRFLLDKANIRIEVLAGQLTRQSRVGYLSFENDEGTRIDYVGEIEGGQAHGQGVGLYAKGHRYEGQWRRNQRHGEGHFYWSDGESYQGEFRQDQRQGKGTYFWPNGEKFVGTWADDQRNGPGTFYSEEGEVVVQGVWKKNKLVKKEK